MTSLLPPGPAASWGASLDPQRGDRSGAASSVSLDGSWSGWRWPIAERLTNQCCFLRDQPPWGPREPGPPPSTAHLLGAALLAWISFSWSCDHSTRGLVTRHSVPCAEKFLLEALPSGTEPQGDGEEQQCPRPKTNLRTLIANCFREKRSLSWAIHVCKCLGTQATAVRETLITGVVQWDPVVIDSSGPHQHFSEGEEETEMNR
ncbi:hypothetical protein R6Z07M_006243 [Ovis aries]